MNPPRSILLRLPILLSLLLPALACKMVGQPPVAAVLPPPADALLTWNPAEPAQAAISLASAGEVEQLARWGNGYLTGLAWSPDGAWLAASSTAGIALYAAASLEAEQLIETQSAANGLAFSPDGLRLAYGMEDGQVQVLRLPAGELEATLDGHRRSVTSVAFSPDGRTLASGSIDQSAILWNVSDGTRLHTLADHKGQVQTVTFSPDGLTLAVASALTGGHGEIAIGGVRLWQVDSGELLAGFAEDRLAVEAAAFLPDGRVLLLSPRAANEEVLLVWEAAASEPQRSFPPSSEIINTFGVSPDGRSAAAGGWEGNLHLLDTATGAEIRSWPAHTGAITAVAFSPDGSRLASYGWDSLIQVWDAATGGEIAALSGFLTHTPVYGVAFSPDSARLASAWGGSGLVRMTELATGREIRLLAGDSGEVNAAAFSADGQMLATAAHQDGMALVWNANTGELLHSLRHSEPVTDVAFSPDSRRLASASWDDTARLWDPASGELIRSFQHGRGVKSVTFSPDGRLLSTASEDNTVKLWDVDSGEEVLSLLHNDWAEAVVFSPDGRMLATSAGDRAFLWDAATGERLAELVHDGATTVKSLAFSPDGSLLVAGCYDDNRLWLWDAAGGRLVVELTGHTSSIWGVAFSPDGRLIASGSADGTVRLWGIPTGTAAAP